MKCREIAACSVGAGPSLGRTSGGVYCRNPVVSDVDADVGVDGECDGHPWCHKRTDIGHSTCRGSDGVMVACPVVSCCRSSRPPVCPPPVRSALGYSSFLSCFILLPPVHSAFGSDDVGGVSCSSDGGCVLTRPLFADASVARRCFLVSFFGVGSPASHASLHPAGSLKLPSRNIAVARRSVNSRQSKCCSASAQRGRGAAAASLGLPGVAPTQSSNKIILNRQVAIVDLGLAGSSAAIDNGYVVGSVSGRQPQQLPSSSHCVLRLRGGASARSSDDRIVGGDDVSSVGSVNEAVGSGIRGGRSWLDAFGEAVERVSAGVLAREEGSRCRAFGHFNKQEEWFRDLGLGRDRVPVSQFPFVEDQGRPHSVVQVRCTPHVFGPCSEGPRFRARLFDPPIVPKDASSASSSSCLRVFGEGRDGNLDQSAISKSGARNAPGGEKVDVGNAEEEPAVLPRWARPFVVPSSTPPSLASWKGCRDGTQIELRMVGRDWVRPGPISYEFSGRCKRHIRHPVLSRSLSLEVGPPSVGNIPRSASVGEGDEVHIGRLQFPGLGELVDQFDDILVRFYGYPNHGRQLFPSYTFLYNKFVGRVPVSGRSGFSPSIRLRNLRIGKLAIVDKLHVGEVVCFRHSTFIHNLGGRKTDTWCSALHVKHDHHFGKNYYVPGST